MICRGNGGEGNDTASDDDRWRDEKQQIIRQAKSTRATDRNSSSSRNSRMTDEDEDDMNDTGGRHHLPGEEEVDTNLSIAHHYDADNEELTEEQLCDTTKAQHCCWIFLW